MIRDLVLPAFDLAVFVDARDGDEATVTPDAVPERAFVALDLLAAGIYHGSAHGFDLFGCVHVFRDDAPFEIFAMVSVVPEGDDGIAVMAQGHEVHAHVEVEADLA